MAISTITIYKNTKLDPSKNFFFDSENGVADYLADLRTASPDNYILIDNFQYVKIEKDIAIKINMSQEWLDDKLPQSPAGNQGYIYVSIFNSDTNRTFYYYLKSKEWTAKNTVKLVLTMDAINTFKLNEDYTLTPQTNVLREHKDRVYNNPITYGGTTYYPRNIHYKSEEIGAIKYRDTSEDETLRENNADYDWYIMFKARNEITSEYPPVVIDTYIIPSENISVGVVGNNLTYSDFTQSNVYYFGTGISGTQQSGDIVVNNNSYTINNAVMSFVATSDKIYLYKYVSSTHGYCIPTIVATFDTTITITMPTSKPLFEILRADDLEVRTGTLADFPSRIIANKISELIPHAGTETIGTINNINTIDRTDTTIYRIVKLPYAPVDIEIEIVEEETRIKTPSYVSRAPITFGANTYFYLKLQDNYFGNLLNNIDNNIEIFKNLYTTFIDADVRNDANESKLYHSDFWTQKLVYDSFTKEIKNENIPQATLTAGTPATKLNIDFFATTTMTSRFMFRFNNIGIGEREEEDYSNVLVVARNNELPLYNNSYLNYIRTGYNYDVKSRMLSGVGSVLGTVGTVASLFDPTKSKLSVFSGIAGTFLGQAQQQNNQEAKEAQLKSQSTSVAGSDDVDLMSVYTGNRAKIVHYKVSDLMAERLADIFYYTGYNTEEMKTPQTHTRKWFNFLQCEAVFSLISNIKDDYIEELKNKYAQGILILHRVNNTYNFNLDKANNETFINI